MVSFSQANVTQQLPILVNLLTRHVYIDVYIVSRKGVYP
jgi:hypothetical protein